MFRCCIKKGASARKQEGKEQMSAIIVVAMIIKINAAHSVHSMKAKCFLVLVCIKSLMISYLLL